MADEQIFTKNGVTRTVSTPRDAVKLAADGWRRVDTEHPAPAKNASSDEWRDYATAQGVPVPSDAGRGDVIAAVEDAGLPVE